MNEVNEYIQFRPLPMQIVIDQRGLFQREVITVIDAIVIQPEEKIVDIYQDYYEKLPELPELPPKPPPQEPRPAPPPNFPSTARPYPGGGGNQPPGGTGGRAPDPPPGGGGGGGQVVPPPTTQPERDTDPDPDPIIIPQQTTTPPVTIENTAKKILANGYYLYHIGGGEGDTWKKYVHPTNTGKRLNLKDPNALGNVASSNSGSQISPECQSAISAGEGWGALYDQPSGGKLGEKLPAWEVWKAFRSYVKKGVTEYDNTDGSNGHDGSSMPKKSPLQPMKYKMGGISLDTGDHCDFWSQARGEALYNLIVKTLEDASGETIGNHAITTAKYWVWPSPDKIKNLFGDSNLDSIMSKVEYSQWVKRIAPGTSQLVTTTANGKKTAKMRVGDTVLSSYYLFPLISLATWYAYNNWGSGDFAGIPNLPMTEEANSPLYDGNAALGGLSTSGLNRNPWDNPERINPGLWLVIPKLTSSPFPDAWTSFAGMYNSDEDYTKDEVFVYLYKTAMKYAVIYSSAYNNGRAVSDNKTQWALNMMLVNYCCKAIAMGG